MAPSPLFLLRHVPEVPRFFFFCLRVCPLSFLIEYFFVQYFSPKGIGVVFLTFLCFIFFPESRPPNPPCWLEHTTVATSFFLDTSPLYQSFSSSEKIPIEFFVSIPPRGTQMFGRFGGIFSVFFFFRTLFACSPQRATEFFFCFLPFFNPRTLTQNSPCVCPSAFLIFKLPVDILTPHPQPGRPNTIFEMRQKTRPSSFPVRAFLEHPPRFGVPFFFSS